MNYSNNLFCYATSELSQDAFICWLVSHLLEENRNLNPTLEACATEFVKCFYPTFPWGGIVTRIDRQYKNIDVLLTIGDKKIIIEDKTYTGTHNDQVNIYKKTLLDSGVLQENIICVYYKIIEQPATEPNVDYEFTRKKLLDIFRKYRTDNVLFQSYLEHLEVIDQRVNSYAKLPIESWDNSAYIGFFSYLRTEVFTEIDSWWSYVSNPTGGFMCLWWSGADKHILDSAGLSSVINELYPQLENNKIAVKMTIKNDTDPVTVKAVRQNLYQYFSGKLGEEFTCLRFHRGKHLTIGYLTYTYQNHREKIDIISQSIQALATDYCA